MASKPNVRAGVAVFILASNSEDPKNPRFLVGKRLGSHGAGTFALPGGHLEFKEELEACAAREVLEETGLKISNVRYLTATNDYMPKEGKHYITVFVVCERHESNARTEAVVLEENKCAGWEWMEWNELVSIEKKEAAAGDGEVTGKTLFIPLLNLVRQRPGVVPA